MPLGAARFGLSGADLGKLELIETKTISGASSSIFTSIKESTYNVHFMTVNDFQPSADNELQIRFFESGVEESASVYQIAHNNGRADGFFSDSRSTAFDRLRAMVGVDSSTNGSGSSYSYFYNLGDSGKYSFQTFHSTTIAENTDFRYSFGSGVLPQASTVDQIKLFVGSGTFSATASLYGIKES